MSAGACTFKLAELKAEAAARGVMDLSSALTKLESASSAPMEDLANDLQVSACYIISEMRKPVAGSEDSSDGAGQVCAAAAGVLHCRSGQ